MPLFHSLFGKRESDVHVNVLTSSEFQSHIKNKNIQLVDVRTEREFNAGHIPNALNINFFSRSFFIEMDKLDKAEPLYLYCRGGSRSSKAAYKLAQRGFKDIYDLQGGILKWNQN